MTYKPFAAFLSLAVLTGLAVGCSDEQQYENAVEEAAEEGADVQAAEQKAAADGTVTTGESAEIREEKGEAAEAAGEAAEQAGELIESRTDN